MKFVGTVDQAVVTYRKSLSVYRASMRQAISKLPGVGAFDNLLSYTDWLVTQPVIPMSAKIAWEDVIQFERMHPDIQAWSPSIGLDTDEKIDLLFEAAILIERQQVEEADVVIASLTALIG